MAGADANMTPDEGAVVDWLAKHDQVCQVCGYQLRGIARAVCSECGSTLELGVIARHMSLGPYIFMIVACACALGFDGVTVLIMTWGLITSRSQPPEFFIIFGVMLILLLGSALALLLTLRSRVKLVQPPGGRWASVISMAFFVFLVHAAAGVFIISFFI